MRCACLAQRAPGNSALLADWLVSIAAPPAPFRGGIVHRRARAKTFSVSDEVRVLSEDLAVGPGAVAAVANAFAAHQRAHLAVDDGLHVGRLAARHRRRSRLTRDR